MDTTNFNCEEHISNLLNDGYTIIRNAFSAELADSVVNDFEKWCETNNDFKKFNYNRVCNFHIYNNNTLDLVTNKYVDKVVSTFLNKEQVIYSSLTFREGTSQHFHRDTPHFFTNPIDQYCGVWYALEDINKESGPLKYYKKSHLIDNVNGYEVFKKCFDENESYAKNNLDALLHYNKLVENKCIELNLEMYNETNYDNINKGDIIIWHPKLLHGGSDVINNSLTRYSMVTHNVPINTQVFNASHFFINQPTTEYTNNICKYKYLLHNDIKYIDHNGNPKVQKSYL